MQSPLLSLLLLLTTAVIAVALARRLKLPSMLSYLVIGMILGPHGLAILKESHEIESVAEFGIVFLMFSIGLEFNLQRLSAMRTLVFGYGAAQVGLTALGALLVTHFGYQQGWRAGLAVGLAVAMSSTAIVAKMLSERLELHSRSGRQTMGVLLFQDLAVVPALILIPALATTGGDLMQTLGVALLQAIAVLGLLIWLGQRFMSRLLDSIAALHSDELFVLTTIWIVIGLAWLTDRSGLSLALGAFIGGMLISETAYRHHVESDIRPFRDMLLGLFFVTIGMLMDVRFVFDHLHLLALAVALLIGGKALVMLAITLVDRSPLPTGLRTAAQLAQGGEFGLVLIELAHAHALIRTDVFQITLSALLLSMFIAPFLIARAARLAGDIGKSDWAHRAKAIHDIASESMPLEDHIILCGYGRTGNRIGDALKREGIEYLVLEIDPHRIARAKSRGCHAAFGSAERREVLKAAGLMRARAVVITYPELHSAERAILAVRRMREDVPLIVRTANESDVPKLVALGANEVVSEILEGGLLMATETLTHIGIPMERALAHVENIRQDRIASLNAAYEKRMERERRRIPRPPEGGNSQ
jgi:CPA2 family monovalent cation:H+ antiporter-2